MFASRTEPVLSLWDMIASIQPYLHLLPLVIMGALYACMAWVILSDVTKYIIPNVLNLIILLLFIGASFVLPTDPLWSAGAAVLVLAFGFAIFALGIMGGGDIKLLVVLTLWTGWDIATPQFIFLTAIFGGVLVILVLLLRFVMGPLWVKIAPRKNLPRLLTAKQPVPYGIAIAAAFAWLLWTGAIPCFAPPEHHEAAAPSGAALTVPVTTKKLPKP